MVFDNINYGGLNEQNDPNFGSMSLLLCNKVKSVLFYLTFTLKFNRIELIYLSFLHQIISICHSISWNIFICSFISKNIYVESKIV